MNAIFHCLRHTFDFTGRLERQPFWIFLTVSQFLIVLLALPLTIHVTVWTDELLKREEVQDILLTCIYTPDMAMETISQQFIPFIGEELYSFASETLRESAWMVICCAVSLLLCVLLFIPTLSATVRRLRDAGYTPWLALSILFCAFPIPFVFEISCIVLIVTLGLCTRPSKPPLPADLPTVPPQQMP